MNLRIIFKAQAIILLINGLGSLFLTSVFIQQAGWTPTADLITIGQFLGVVFIVNGIWSWRFPDVAAESIKSIGMLFALGGLLFTAIILFHIITGAVAGATAYVNIILTALFAIGFYIYSR